MKQFLLILASLAPVIFAYETPSWVHEKYQAVYQSKLTPQEDGSMRFHEGKLFRRGGIRILSLKGDEFEMAFQHGRLLQQDILQGALPETAALLEKSVKNILPEIPILTSSVVEYFYSNYTDKILQHGIKSAGGDANKILLEAYGLSEGAQIPLDTVIRGVLGPESLQVVLGERMKGKTALPAAGSVNSCTDFVVKGQATPQGEMVIGRNTDYPLNGFFDKFPTLIYYQPTDGAQKYLAVTSAGLHNAGVIGFNESGLFLGIHTIPTTEVSADGNPIFLVGQEVMRYAKSFDEAVAIIEKYKSAAGWTYTLASVYENRMASVEITNKRVAVRESKGDWHAQTNHYQTSTLSSANLDLNATINEDSRARLIRAEQLIRQNWGGLSVEEAVQVLSDKFDPINNEVRGFGNVIAVHTTLSSAVFDPARGRLFMASGMGPVSLTPYIELPLIREFDESTFSSGPFKVLENSSFHQNFPLLSKAEQKFIEAKTAFETYNDPKTASLTLKESTELDPENSAYSFVHGILSIKAGDLASAESSFLATTKKKYVHYRLASQYYLGRIWASQGKKAQAKKVWLSILTEADPRVEKTLIAAVAANLKKIKWGRVPLNKSALVLFMPEGDMIEY
ncbi:MAG: C45 family autoproteolytic acyltransferase/hydrolase [Pseudomonadota bacterium]